MIKEEEIDLLRNCVAINVPWGKRVILDKGSRVTITQERGGSFTILYTDNLYRIEGIDADALGKEPVLPSREPPLEVTRENIEKMVWEQLATCFDPEIPIDIVALGLVYDCTVTPIEQVNKFRVVVHMTLTSPGCGMADYIVRDVRDKLNSIPGVAKAKVRLVWNPPWSEERMSDAARLEAGLL
ncbi:MAG: putative Fe-S cluster assembly protein SufT [Spirochaetia bacterium]|jgi:probable FeS assembly SUF system protein SufT|nr:putative Fe-S cluster assembly protein SufT [Spirochaetia bacterium]